MSPIWFLLLFVFTLVRASSGSSTPSQNSAGTYQTNPDAVINCTAVSSPLTLKGVLFTPKSSTLLPNSNDASSSGVSGRGLIPFGRPGWNEVTEMAVSVDSSGEACGSVTVFNNAGYDDKNKYVLMTGRIWTNDEGRCIKNASQIFVETMGQRSRQILLIFVVKKEMANSDSMSKWMEDGGFPKDKLIILVAEPPNSDPTKYSSPDTCTLFTSEEDLTNQQDSLLNNFSRTSVLFVSVSFIILMVISLAWLVFYYVQRFRYAHAKDRLARRLFNAAKKALTKIPAKTLRQGDKELDSDCSICIEPYHAADVIRTLPCKHVFHKTCVDPWLLEHRTCPMCKMDILKAFGYHFGHSEESVRDADQLSAAGQSTDGASGESGTSGHGGPGQRGFPLSLPTDSDLHDPFFPSPLPSPPLLQQVLHSSDVPNFAIIPMTVHRHRIAPSSDTSADSNGSWLPGGAEQCEYSAEVHHDGPAVADAHRHRFPPVHTTKQSPTSSKCISTEQGGQALFHSRSTGTLRSPVQFPVNAVDSGDSDDGETRNRPIGGDGQKRQKGRSTVDIRGRSASQTAASTINKTRLAMCAWTTPPPTTTGSSARIVTSRNRPKDTTSLESL